MAFRPGRRIIFAGGRINWNEGQIRIMLTGSSGEVAEDVRRRGRAVQKRAQRRVRAERYDTGELYHSIGVRNETTQDGPVSRITADADHAMMVEFGRKRVRPVNGKWLHWQGDYAPVFALEAAPVSAVPFMRDALDAAVEGDVG